MYLIGLTGGSGAGKSFVAALWRELGARILDCDALYHTLLRENEELCKALGARFPEAVRDGIDRALLRKIVFADPEALADLNRISHAFVLREARRILEGWRQEGVRVAVVEAIYLLETGLGRMCCHTVALVAPPELRLARLQERDGLPKTELMARLRAQQPDSFFREGCDTVLENKGGETALQNAARELYYKLLEKSITEA